VAILSPKETNFNGFSVKVALLEKKYCPKTKNLTEKYTKAEVNKIINGEK